MNENPIIWIKTLFSENNYEMDEDHVAAHYDLLRMQGRYLSFNILLNS